MLDRTYLLGKALTFAKYNRFFRGNTVASESAWFYGVYWYFISDFEAYIECIALPIHLKKFIFQMFGT